MYVDSSDTGYTLNELIEAELNGRKKMKTTSGLNCEGSADDLVNGGPVKNGFTREASKAISHASGLRGIDERQELVPNRDANGANGYTNGYAKLR